MPNENESVFFWVFYTLQQELDFCVDVSKTLCLKSLIPLSSHSFGISVAIQIHIWENFYFILPFHMQGEIKLNRTQPAALYDLRDPKPSIFSMRT